MYLKESDIICQCLSGIQLYIYDFVFISILLFCMFVECFLFFVVVFFCRLGCQKFVHIFCKALFKTDHLALKLSCFWCNFEIYFSF